MLVLFMGFLNISNMFENTKIILCMIIGVIFYKLSYKDNIYKCIMINLLFWLGLIINESVSISIVVMLNRLESIQLLLAGNIFRMQAIFISKILLTLELILFKYFRLSLEFKLKDMILIGIPIVSNIAILLLVYGYNFSQSIVNRFDIAIVVIITLLIVLSSVMLIIVIGKIVQHDKIKLEYELINERINTNHKRYEGINEIHNKLRYVYHDLKNHMTCIKNYNTKEEIVSYINKLELQISDFEKLRNTGNATLDIILGEKTHLCKKYNIEFEDYINISKLNFIQENDLCSIFANALDNAIEIIKFTNTKVNDIKFTGEKIETSKNNKKIHGIGISSIKYIVSKYKGEVLVNYSKNEFILKIMIPITKEEIITNEKNSIKVT